MKASRNILLMMSGSIACAKATGLLSAWVKQGHRVRVACTPSVRQFVGPATLEGLSGEPVFDDTFATGRAMDHISLARWADLIVVCPATGNLINKLAAGIGDDAVTTLWQAAWGRKLPLFLVPAMNTHMWDYPATRESLKRLRGWGVHVLPTAEGDLACGEHGAGRMLEPEQIMDRIDALLAFDRAAAAGRVLVTGGGTREPIDEVRFIGNQSTGRTAATLADRLQTLGYHVTWLGGVGAAEPQLLSDRHHFVSFRDLQRQLRRLLAAQRYDAVVHAAAVADFSVAGRSEGGDAAGSGGGKAPAPAINKLPSDRTQRLELKPTPKLLALLRSYAGDEPLRVVGFKLTVGASASAAREAVARQFAHSGPDWVVHNDLREIQAGRHRFTLYDAGDRDPPGPRVLEKFEDAGALGLGLARRLGEDAGRSGRAERPDVAEGREAAS